MSTLYLHIGLSKTGSTFLQKRVFSSLSGFDYLCKPAYELINGRGTSLRRFFNQSAVVWRDLGDTLFHKLFGPVHTQREDVLISDENVCSQEPSTRAEHLSEFNALAGKWGFDQVRVFGSVRHQASRFASSYAQISDSRIGASQRDFENWVRQRIRGDYYRSDYYRSGVKYEYDLLWQSLTDVLGKENVLILPYELMKQDLEDFLERCFVFMERESESERIIGQLMADKKESRENVRSVSKNNWALRKCAKPNTKTFRLRPGRLVNALGLPARIALPWPDFARGDVIRLAPSLEHEIMQTYEESNRNLAKHIEIDLSAYNYY